MNFISFSFAVLVLTAASFSQACPLGDKEDHLTLQRVMLNFGKFVRPADAISVKSLNKFETVTDSELQTAIDKLDLAISCADAVIKDPKGDLLPSAILFLKEESAKKELADDFVYFMGDFKDGLGEYRESLKQVLAQKPDQRDFQAVRDMTAEMNKRVDRAHRKTSP